MKFLVDENLPPRLAVWLQDRSFEATHVKTAGLAGRADGTITAVAIAQQCVIVTKDDDDNDMQSVRVLHLGIGNCTTTRLLEWITPLLADAVARLSAGERYVRLD